MSFLALVVFGSKECCFGGARDWLLAVTRVLGCSGCGAVAGGVFQRLLLNDFSLVRDVTWIVMIKKWQRPFLDLADFLRLVGLPL